ncbi:MAG: hypothetical protein Q8Q09_24435 [Deltaproteobacteria bacterium]|nr:hypothetical protein [Deltaproteobacteria bacterium]
MSDPPHPQRWIFSRRVDLLLFGGTTCVSLALVIVGKFTGLWEKPFPWWAWLALVVGVDVAHVWGSLYRVYFDPSELRRRPWHYGLTPVVVFVVGGLLAQRGTLLFWRALAYLAAFHFVRQQVGFVAIYHRLAGESHTRDAALDRAAIYAATGYALVHWHAHLPRAFDWFFAGDFVSGLPRWVSYIAQIPTAMVLGAWGLRTLMRALGGRAGALPKLNLGAATVVLSTAMCWLTGIVWTHSDWAFTVTNVPLHGVPYMALVWRYSAGRYSAQSEPSEQGAAPKELGFAAWIVSKGPVAFVATLVAFALCEEFLWDRTVWHERSFLFGEWAIRPTALFTPWILAALSTPQVTHYLLDGWVWRGGSANPSLMKFLKIH